MRLGALEYISLMERLGRFAGGSPVPECNTGVWREYLALYDRHAAPLSDIEIISTPEGYGFYRDPLAGERFYTWALLGPVSHPVLPFPAAGIVEHAEKIAGIFVKEGVADAAILTDTFVPADGLGDERSARHFVWLNSPQAKIFSDFTHYESSLTADRRKQMRRLFRQYDDSADFSFSFSGSAPEPEEMDFLVENTRARWGTEWAYALVQALWPLAISRVMPEKVRFMRVYRQGKLIFFNSYIIRGDVITSQSTTRSESDFFSGLGVMIDFKTIRMLAAQDAVRYLDPTCRTTMNDPDSIGIAKREVINHNARKPVFALGPGFDRSMTFFEPGQGWHMTDTESLFGRAV